MKIQKYFGAAKESIFYCMKHNKEFKKYYGTLLYCKSGCDECYCENIRERQGMGIEEFKQRLYKVHPELTVVGEYINNISPIKVYCQKHEYEYSLGPVALLSRLTCCDKTRTTYKEENVCQLLEKWGFAITRQKVFGDCIDKRVLPFDIYLNDFNTVIEYQGEQHYKPIRYSIQSFDDATNKYNYTVKHDKIKKEYCKKHRIRFIEIPYWEYDDLEYYLFDQLVKNKIIIEETA